MDQIEEVRRKIDIVGLISEAVTLKKAGRNFKGLCPFHEEKTPSFIISPERQIFKCFGCFPAGELIKTKYGLKPIELIEKGEEVYTHKGNWKPVTRLLERDYQGNLVFLKLSQLTEEVRLTTDHMVYVVGGARMYRNRYKYLSKRLNYYRKHLSIKRMRKKVWKYFPIEKIPAGNLKKGMSLLYPIDTTVADLETIDLSSYITRKERAAGTQPKSTPLKLKVDENLLKLLGYYIAEGSNHRAYIRFSLGGHEQKFAKEIRWLIHKLFGVKASLHQRMKGKSGLEVTACNSVLANIFGNLCGKGAGNKHIPFIFQQLPSWKQKVLLQAIARGDGHTTKISERLKTRRENIVTISRTLAGQLTSMLLRMDFYPSRLVNKEHKDKKGQHHEVSFLVSWAINPEVSRFHHKYEAEDGSVYWILPVWEISKRQFKGTVYNLTIEQDHSYVANSFVVANCGEGGDVYGWLMKREGMEFGEALRFLAQKAGVELKDFRPSGDQKLKERLLEVNHLASEFYHYLLTQHRLGKRGFEYLLKRGITKDSIRLFKLGYSPNEWQGLTDYLTKKKGYKPEEVEAAGLIIRRTPLRQGYGGVNYYDRFRGRIMFPLFDHRGRVVGFAGRVLNPEEKEAKYINSPETVLYHKSLVLYGLEITKEAVKKANRAIVVEGELDAISSYQAGVKNVAAIKGSALTEGQIELLKRFCENVSLALDSDSAGEAASRRGIELAEKLGLNVRIIRVKDGKDPDECAQKSARLWKDSVSEAVAVYDFLIEAGVKRYGVKTVEGKRKLSEEMAGVLAKVDNEVIKAHYMKKLAKVLEVEEEAVRMEVEKKEKVGQVENVEKAARVEQEKTRQERLEEYLLALILQADKEMKKFVSLVKLEEWGETVIKKILEQLQQWLKKDKEWEINKFVKSLAEELTAQVDAAYLLDLGRLTEDRDRLEREIEKTLADIKRLNIKQKLEQLSREISQAEKEKDRVKLSKLQKEFRETAKSLI